MEAQTIVSSLQSVLKAWTRQRKSEDRNNAQESGRYNALVRERRTTIKEAAWSVMAESYFTVSGPERLPAQARQIMYTARPKIMELTNLTLDDKNFTQKLLPDYLAAHPKETASWDVVFDARGRFAEPHTRLTASLSTVEVRNYVERIRTRVQAGPSLDMPEFATTFPTCGPENRFNAILFVEKEGFLPLFRAVRLAERYDVALMSTKGMSVVAARALVDNLCGQYDIPLLVLRDFDKSGFSIVGTLKRNTRRYTFRNKIEVIDLGLRLTDIIEWGLPSEPVMYNESDPTSNLMENGATAEEVAFLRGSQHGKSFRGRRVELNAFTSVNFIAWIERKLQECGVNKVIPDAPTLERAFRRATEIAILQRHLRAISEEVHQEAMRASIPEGIVETVLAMLQNNPELSWDAAITHMVAGGEFK
jgi:hypothetical protein